MMATYLIDDKFERYDTYALKTKIPNILILTISEKSEPPLRESKIVYN